MNRYELIEKTITNKRGYKYHTYETNYEDGILELYHYGTLIFKADLNKNKVLSCVVYSKSDTDTISTTMWALNSNGYLKNHIFMYGGIYIMKSIQINDVMVTLYIHYTITDKINKIRDVLKNLNDHELKALDNMSAKAKINVVNIILDGKNDDETLKVIRRRIKLSAKMVEYNETMRMCLEARFSIFKNAIMIKGDKDTYFISLLLPEIYMYPTHYPPITIFSEYAVKFDKLQKVRDIPKKDVDIISDVLDMLNVYHAKDILKHLVFNKLTSEVV